MTQQSLIVDKPEFIGVLGAAPKAPLPEKPSALATLREHALSVDVETMRAGLSEFWDRRQEFRAWLLSHMVEGQHFGTPPGCEPKGNVNPKQWQSKPSLYKAGAAFVAELLGVRIEFQADNDAWAQLGSEKGKFVFVCRLYSSAAGKLLGEGRGARRVGAKSMDENATLKMAQKSALCDAVLNTWALADLFQQDQEDGDIQPPHDNPAADPAKPKSAPRGQRVSEDELKGLVNTFKARRPPSDRTAECFAAFVMRVTERQFNARQPAEWSAPELTKCRKALEDGQ